MIFPRRFPNRFIGKVALGLPVWIIWSFSLVHNPYAADSLTPRLVATASARSTARQNSELAGVRNRFPLYFIENRGQADPRASYYIHGADKTLYFGSTSVTMVLSKPIKRESAQADFAVLGAAMTDDRSAPRAISPIAVTLEFVGANPSVAPVGEELSPARFSYFTGPRENWVVGLKSYTRLVYADLWPGIDLVYTASIDRLKYLFVVKPGADPKWIKLRYRGAESVSLDKDGKLLIGTAVEDFRDDRPTAHQEIYGTVKDVNAEYVLLDSDAAGGQAYGFKIGTYNDEEVLIIDPAILVYSGFIGGTDDDRGNAIAVDADGNAFVTGETNSLQSSFPVTGRLDAAQNGGIDAFVAKVDASGTRLLFAGFIGGAGDDRGKSIAVDSLGNAYITGETSSEQTSFPVTIGPDLTYNGQIDAFVAKINAAGTDLVYAGYIGGINLDRGAGIAVDNLNRAYVTGETASPGGSFPNGAGLGGLNSFDSSQNGGLDAFVARVAANGASLEYAGFIGGIGTDRGTSIAVDTLNRAYITGETDSSSASFPNGIGFGGLTTFDSSINGGVDAFVARVASDGQALDYAGYLGGSLADRGNGIVVDGTGNAYVTGETSSDGNPFPNGNGLAGLPGPGQIQRGGVDAFAAKINAAGNALVYAGFIGGTADDRGNAIALMPGCANNCEVFITGETSSVQSSFPVSIGPVLFHNGGVDAFIAKINANGSIGLAGFLGGTGDDRGKGIALDSFGDVYVTGETSSNGGTFPIKGPLDRTQNLAVDAFVAKVCVTICADVSVTKSDSPDPATLGTNVSYTITVTNHGPDIAADVELTDVLPAGVGLLSVTPTVGACAGASTIICDFGDLANGASATVTIVVSTAAAGKLTNTATVSSAATDTDPSNNVAQEQTQVTQPNLLVKRISAAAAAVPGSSIVVNDTTVNNGKVAAAASATNFYLSVDSKFDGGDQLLGIRSPIPALLPKQSSSGSTTLTIPLATVPGRYFIIAVADAGNLVSEGNEKNAKARALNVTLPDLVVSSLRSPSSAAAGASVTVQDSTSNKAPVPAAASTTRYYLSLDAVFDGADVLLGSRSVPALGAKERSNGSAAFTVPLGTTPGKYFLLAVSDAAGAVSEAVENNNSRARSMTITP